MRIYNNSYIDVAKQKVLLKVFRVSFLCFLLTMAVLAVTHFYQPLRWDLDVLRSSLFMDVCIIWFAEYVWSHFAFWREFSQTKMAGVKTVFDKVHFVVTYNFGVAIATMLGVVMNGVAILALSDYSKNYQCFLKTHTNALNSGISENIITFSNGVLGYTQNLWLVIVLGFTAAFLFSWFTSSKLLYCIRYTREPLCKVQPTDTVTITKKDSNTITLDLTREYLLLLGDNVIVHATGGNVFKVYRESELKKITVTADNNTDLIFNQRNREWEVCIDE